MKEFGNLPIFDEEDEAGCDSLNPVRVGDTRYELKGAIRYSPTDVRAVFWLKRDTTTESGD